MISKYKTARSSLSKRHVKRHVKNSWLIFLAQKRVNFALLPKSRRVALLKEYRRWHPKRLAKRGHVVKRVSRIILDDPAKPHRGRPRMVKRHLIRVGKKARIIRD